MPVRFFSPQITNNQIFFFREEKIRKLIVDTYNIYKRVENIKGKNIFYNFFNHLEMIKNKFKATEICLVFDSPFYIKKTLYEEYKSNRKPHSNGRFMKSLKNMVEHIPGYTKILGEGVEADDLCFNYVKDNHNAYLYSTDSDWIISLVANKAIRIYNGKEVIHEFNFQEKFGFPLHLLPLYYFLKGDIKDNVKKPFRLQEPIIEAVLKYKTINNYLKENNLEGSKEVKLYKQIIFPFTNVEVKVIQGKRSDHTRELITKFGLTFMRKLKLDCDNFFY